MASPPVHIEDETKLGVSEGANLGDIRGHILKKSGHYVPAKDNAFKAKPVSYRVYYDTPDLDLDALGIQIRIKKKTKPDGSVKYKQTIKIGEDTRRRQELEHAVSNPQLDFSVLNKPEKKALKKALGNKKIEGFQLLPLVRLEVESQVFNYHPDGKKSKKIEVKTDHVTITTVIDALIGAAPVIKKEVEQEDKGGAHQVMESECTRLKEEFNKAVESDALHEVDVAKPHEGFARLKDYRREQGDLREILKDVESSCDPEGFLQIIQALSAGKCCAQERALEELEPARR